MKQPVAPAAGPRVPPPPHSVFLELPEHIREDWHPVDDIEYVDASDDEAEETEAAEDESTAEDDLDEDDITQEFPAYVKLCAQFTKTFYLGSTAELDEDPTTLRVTRALTELCVEDFGVELNPDQGGLNRLSLARAAEITSTTVATPTALLLALLYLERLRTNNPAYLHRVSSTDLFLVSMMVASKYLHDDGESEEVFADEWATAGKMEKRDLHNLELAFLDALDWSLYVAQTDFDRITHQAESRIATKEVTKRGWASYTDLLILTRHLPIVQVWEIIAECSLKVTAVCASAYAASIFTMMSTVYLLNKTPLGPIALHTSFCSPVSPPVVTVSRNASFSLTHESQAHHLLEVDQEDPETLLRVVLNTALLASNDSEDATSASLKAEYRESQWNNLDGNISDLNRHSTSVVVKPYSRVIDPPDPGQPKVVSAFQTTLERGLQKLADARAKQVVTQCLWKKLSVFGVNHGINSKILGGML